MLRISPAKTGQARFARVPNLVAVEGFMASFRASVGAAKPRLRRKLVRR
jgi:hypothetical protein